MSERHWHSFVPPGGWGQRGSERMEQYCRCGARRCVGKAAGGFGKTYPRHCTLAALPGERHCQRHKERPRGEDWIEKGESLLEETSA
jgi:hypothetical protein